jgi:hypothetical protein
MERERLRTLIGLVFMLIIAYLLILSNPEWDSPRAAIMCYSILAFLSVTFTTSAMNRIRTDPSPAHKIFVAGAIYASITFTGAAIFYIFNYEGVVIHSQTAGIFLNLVAYATTGLIMLFYSLWSQNPPKEDSIANSRFLIVIVVMISTAVFVLLMYVARLSLDQSIFLIAGYITGVTAILSYLIATITILKQTPSFTTHDSKRLGLVFALLAAASTIHTLILSSPSIFWMMSIALTAIAFFIAVVATGYPFLIDIGLDEKTAYGIVLTISALVFLPFLCAYFIENLVPIVTIVEFGTTLLVHMAATALAGSAAYALFMRSKYRSDYSYIPIVYLLIGWAVAETAIIVSHLTPIYGIAVESEIPYIFGTFISAVMLSVSIRRILSPPTDKDGLRTAPLFILWIITCAIMIIFGEYLRLQLLNFFTSSFLDILGNAIMLCLSYITLFALLNYFMLIAGISGGELSIDTMTAGLTSVWVITVILKVNYADYTTGWWTAEAVMVIAVAFLPLTLLRMYLIDLQRKQELEKQATLYSRFLSTRIASLQTPAIDILESVSMDPTMSDEKLKSVSQALADIARANEFAKCMESIIVGERFSPQLLESIDLVDAIMNGLSKLTDQEPSFTPLVYMNMKKGEAFVRANDFLVDAFQSVFQGILKRIGKTNLVNIEILSQMEDDSQQFWTSQITIELESGDAFQKKALFDRYTKGESSEVMEFSYARRLVQLFGGIVRFEAAILQENAIVITITVSLLKFEES